MATKKISIILCVFFAVCKAVPTGPFLGAQLSYEAWPGVLSYGLLSNSRYYTATKSINIAAPQPMIYVSIPTWLAPAPVVVGSHYHAQDTLGQHSNGYANDDGKATIENRALDGIISGKNYYIDSTGRHVETKYRTGSNGFEVGEDRLPQAPEVSEHSLGVDDAYNKARADLEEAKNHKGSRPLEKQLQVAAPALVIHSAHTRYPKPAAFSKSAHYNWN